MPQTRVKTRRSSSSSSPSLFFGAKLSLENVIFFMICAVPVCATIAFGAVDMWASGLLSLVAALIVILWLAYAWRKNEFQFSANKLQLPIFGLIIIGLIQLLPFGGANAASDALTIPISRALSLNPYATRLTIVQLAIYSVFFAAALTFINNRRRFQTVVLTVIVFGALMGFYGILQELAGTEDIYGMRPPGQAFPFASFVNRHHFAAFMEMTGGVALGLLFGSGTLKNKRVFLIIAAVIMGIALLFTSSRGGWLSFLGVLGFIILAKLADKNALESNKEAAEGYEAGAGGEPEKKQSLRQSVLLFGGAAGLILILFAAVVWLGGDESLTRGVGMQNSAEDISNGRFHFWQIALKIFADYPILGAGLDAFGTAFPRYDNWSGAFRVEQAHNDYLQILADAGIFGITCAAAFIFLLFRQGLRVIRNTVDSFQRSAKIGALAGCFGILFHSFFDFPMRTPSNALFFLLLVALTQVEFKEIHHQRTKKER